LPTGPRRSRSPDSFVGGATDSAASELNPEELASLVTGDLVPLSIGSEPVFQRHRLRAPLPQYNLATPTGLAAVANLPQQRASGLAAAYRTAASRSAWPRLYCGSARGNGDV